MTKRNSIYSFSQQVYEVVKRIPSGKVATYGQIAAILCKSKAARAVGQALNKNPQAPIVPCHRVVDARGHLRGFAQGLRVKEKLLKNEGIKVVNGFIDLKKYRLEFLNKAKGG